MQYIKKIEIQNFKCFLSNQITLNNLTILAGANAVGKSTLIQAFLIIRQTIDKLSNNINSVNSISDYDDILLNGPYNLNLGDSAQILSSNAKTNEIYLEISGDNDREEFKYSVSKDKQEIVIKHLISDKKPNIKSNLTIFNESFYYLSAERLGPRVVQQISNQNYSHTGINGEYTGYSLANNEQFKVETIRRFFNKDNKKVSPLLKKQVESWMDFIVPGIEITNTIYRDINLVSCHFKRTYSDTAPLNPNNIGFGISYVLPIIVTGLIAKRGSILLIENPEAHLHPSGQSKIGQFLAQIASSGIQIIIETHSEHIINGIRLGVLKNKISPDLISINFFGMEKKSDNPSIEHITLNEKVKLSKWPIGFFDQEERDLAEMFQFNKNER